MTSKQDLSRQPVIVDDEVTTLNGVALVLAGTLQARGIDVDPLLSEAGIDPQLLSRMGLRIPMQRMAVFWQAAVRETGLANIGLEVAKRFHITHLHAFYFAMQASNTVREAFDTFLRFSAVISTAMIAEFDTANGRAELVVRVRENCFMPCPEAIDATAAITVRFMQEFMAMEADDFLSISLPRPAPEQPEHWQAALGCPITFGSKALIVRFHPRVLDRALPTANPAIAKANSELLVQYLDGLNNDFLSRATQRLSVLLNEGRATQEALAQALDTSPRNLQRKMQSEGLNFRQLLDELRQKQALEEVRSTTRPLTDIAHTLGFSDSASFSRAFKRWTGVAPKDYRNAASV
ncbi:AraC family transcriptional regulator [Parendozoicomonas haliclonae]|uniref:HTH-type transcriptional regulator VirS n=1 Tax=Parendozoicomonas haliclonae TaxID=1960125 RepID=A0A1X7AR89_9GAMM|nr:AraC family transcriptional regulator [Parendozoicomonas haliclonae]SMA50834.1 HTH-type transcriptional regulator VirS [Parendozoicomonas haliclonae]